MTDAITLSDWFGREARRVYGMFVESEEDRRLREVAEWIRRRGGVVSAREVQQARRDCLTAEDAEALLNALVEAGLGEWEPVAAGRKGGRPTRVFRLSTPPTKQNPTNHGKNEGSVDVDSVDSPESEVDEWPTEIH
jgi:hypothetical protein